MNVLLRKRIGCYLTVLVTIALIMGCSTTIPPEDTPPALFSELQKSSDFYLSKDVQLGSEKNLVWQFLVIQALTQESKFIMADAVIESLQTQELTTKQSATLHLLIANNYYAQNKLPETQQVLATINLQVIDQVGHIFYLKLQVALHIHNELPLEASDSLLLLTTLLTNHQEKQIYNDLLLKQLTQLTSKQLTQYRIKSTLLPLQKVPENSLQITGPAEISIDTDFKAGWYALAALYQENKLRPNRLTRALNQWSNTYFDHAALQFMPQVLTNIVAFSPYQPDNIAVLLPLSGRFKKQGKAIQTGILNAYYKQYKGTHNKQSGMPILHFFDTQKTNSEQLALQLKQANIDFVIGPLLKKEIEELLPHIENIPVLALNSFEQKVATDKMRESADKFPSEDTIETELENTQQKTNIIAWHYAFPLSPEEEAKQAAQMIYSDQHKNPLIIVPNSNYGKRVANAFKVQWATLTSNSELQTEVHYFGSKAKLNTFIDDVLQTGKSKRRISQMRVITDISLKTEVRSRRDVDAIYIVSKRDELILLKPFIDVSVSPFAKKIPLYASSRSHSFDRNNMQNKDLSRLVFSDSPFLLEQQSELSKEVDKSWKMQSVVTLRLFALGFDSYQLIEQLIYLQNNHEATYSGLIGELRLGTNNNIESQLSWAKYQNGELYEVASPITTK